MCNCPTTRIVSPIIEYWPTLSVRYKELICLTVRLYFKLHLFIKVRIQQLSSVRCVTCLNCVPGVSGSGDSGVCSPCSYISLPCPPPGRPRYCDPHLNYMDRVVMEIVETEGVYVRDLQQVIEVSERNEELRDFLNEGF